MDQPDLASGPTAEIARSLGLAAALSERAIVVGNRAGIVEWANQSWTRITGFPLAETIAKPITHFLEQTSIDLELVDFVAQNFLDARPSTIEFPFETFDDREIWVHLEVQPIRNAQGEIAEFVAVATDVTERRQHERETTNQRSDHDRIPAPTAPEGPTPARPNSRLSLSAEVEIACEHQIRNDRSHTYFDLALESRLPSIESDRLLLGEVIRKLLHAATVGVDESWGFVTVMTGQTRLGRSHVSAAHPISVRPAPLATDVFAFVEVHDTSATLSPAAIDAISRGERIDDPRADSLTTASILAKTLGGSLHIDSTPGCGTQSLLLLPLSLPSAAKAAGATSATRTDAG